MGSRNIKYYVKGNNEIKLNFKKYNMYIEKKHLYIAQFLKILTARTGTIPGNFVEPYKKKKKNSRIRNKKILPLIIKNEKKTFNFYNKKKGRICLPYVKRFFQ